MKCENCGKNEVTLIYQSNINGHVTEKRLCAECAEQMGITGQLAKHSQRMMRSFDNMFSGSFFDDFFSSMPSLMGRRMWMLEDPFEDLFSEMPALSTSPAKQEEQPKQEELVNQKEQSRFARMRQLNALRLEMKKAAHREDFERAAQLRDQIRQLEAEHNNDQESV